MKYFKIGDLNIPSEFILTEDINGYAVKNAHYVVNYNDNYSFNVVIYNGKNVSGSKRIITLHFFIDHPCSFKEYSLEKYNNLKAFL